MDMMIWKEIAEHWPSLMTGLLAAVVYVRLHRFAARQKILEKRVKRLMDVCAEQHPEKGRTLFDDGNGGE